MSARAQLLAAALRRFAADGALNATLDDVRKDAGVSVGALYHHFKDKRALATALYLDGLADYQREFSAALASTPSAQGAIEATVHQHLRWCAQHHERARFLFDGRGGVDDAAVQAASAPFLQHVGGWYRGHAHYGAVRELPFDLVHALWLGPAQEYARHWLAGRARTVPRAAADELAAAAWRALGTTDDDAEEPDA